MNSGSDKPRDEVTTPERNEVLELLFDAASVFTRPHERDRFLSYACRGEPEMRRQIESLIGMSSPAEDFFEFEPQFSAAEVPAMIAHADGLGVDVGRYRLIERIGAGGCGVVYLAEQREPVRRKVALKIIRLGLEGPEAVARFEAERQALASMNHPGIARILDAGTTETGRPYYVMELVDGEAITSYCDSHQLGIRKRLELFIEVCRAIQHAHQKSVVHRDIKPSNILIDRMEATPVPKVIDFGIAWNIGPLTDDQEPVEASLIGTPAYMSPEQWTENERIDTRSDIYSLGILLSELLAGRPSHLADDLPTRTTREIKSIIQAAEPVLPSAALASHDPQERSRVAQKRNVSEDRLLTWCRSELDWVVGKAVARDPSARYGTAQALAEDIARWLRNEPVSAHPQTRRYRLAKLVNRNRLWFGAGTLAFCGLIGGLGIATLLFLREKEARAEQEKLRVQAETAHQAEKQTRKLWEYRSRVSESAVRLRYQDFIGAEELVAPIPIEETPGSLEAVSVFKQLAEWHRSEGRMERAEKYFLSTVHTLSNIDRAHTDSNSDNFLAAATALAMSANPQRYESLRRIALDLYEGTENQVVAERTLKAVLLKPASAAILERSKHLASVLEGHGVPALATGDLDLNEWMCFALALQHYREGDDELAKSYALRSIEKKGPNPVCSLSAKVVLGLVSQRQGNSLEAMEYFTSVEQQAGANLSATLPYGGTDGGFWYDWANIRILLQEAGFWKPPGNAPTAEPPLSLKAKVTVSFARNGMNPARLNDQQMRRAAVAGVETNFDFWPHVGGSEWIRYEWNEPVQVSKVTASWFDDTASGGDCGLPDAWRLSYLDDGGNWKPVEMNSPYSIRQAEPVNVEFTPVTTKALRLDLDLKDGLSAGLYEWEVNAN
jgi:serine/threonine protein kinase